MWDATQLSAILPIACMNLYFLPSIIKGKCYSKCHVQACLDHYSYSQRGKIEHGWVDRVK